MKGCWFVFSGGLVQHATASEVAARNQTPYFGVRFTTLKLTSSRSRGTTRSGRFAELPASAQDRGAKIPVQAWDATALLEIEFLY